MYPLPRDRFDNIIILPIGRYFDILIHSSLIVAFIPVSIFSSKIYVPRNTFIGKRIKFT
jgi:hypothetical protein